MTKGGAAEIKCNAWLGTGSIRPAQRAAAGPPYGNSSVIRRRIQWPLTWQSPGSCSVAGPYRPTRRGGLQIISGCLDQRKHPRRQADALSGLEDVFDVLAEFAYGLEQLDAGRRELSVTVSTPPK
jgi:hypothetical protein